MQGVVNPIVALLMLSNLALTAGSRLKTCISLVAFQGVLLGALALSSRDGVELRTTALAALVILLKGYVFPRLLTRAVRDADVRREVEPFIGYGASILIGMLLTAVSFWVGHRLPAPHGAEHSSLVVTGAMATILTGLFLIVSRRKAVTQVLGYLVMENGIAAFALAMASEIPLLVELGTLLDVFVGVFVMAIVIWHIGREFDHMDVDRLSTLKG